MPSATTGRSTPSLQTASPKDTYKMRIPQSTAKSQASLLNLDFSNLELRVLATLKPCKSPYCECDEGKCSHPGFYDARSQAAQELMEKPKTL